MIKTFETLEEYNNYTADGLKSGDIYYVKEDGSIHFYTNNIDGEAKVYNKGNIPEGNITIDENGTGIDIAKYATATVDVPTKENDLINLIERDITSFEIPAGTTRIGQYAFYQIPFTSITIPNTVTSIGDNSFYQCKLESITIPASVTFIGVRAFNYSTSLTNVTFMRTNAFSVSESTFANCSNLTSITIPGEQGNQTIASSVFQSCTKLNTVILGTNIKQISYRAFYGCTSLQSFTIKTTTPPTLGAEVFGGISNSFNIYVPADSVAAYKAAAGWSEYANDIEAIA